MRGMEGGRRIIAIGSFVEDLVGFIIARERGFVNGMRREEMILF